MKTFINLCISKLNGSLITKPGFGIGFILFFLYFYIFSIAAKGFYKSVQVNGKKISLGKLLFPFPFSFLIPFKIIG